jgi:hypothetical protein
MSDFYVTLDSGASPDYFEKNRISDFRNKLSVPIKLEHGMYEVALVECSYIHSAKVIDRNETLFKYKIFDRKQQGKGKGIAEKVKAYYSVYDENGLISVLNDSNKVAIKFRKYEDTYIELLHFERFDLSLEFSEKLMGILGHKSLTGFKNVTDEYSDEENEKSASASEGGVDPSEFDHYLYYRTKNKLELRAGQTRIFVYCDIIKPSHVGNTMAPLLRSFMNSGQSHGTNITKSFDHLQYFDLRFPEFEMIHVYIKNECGDPILFESGTFSLTLHFRPKKY